jgi:hypothetical protein
MSVNQQGVWPSRTARWTTAEIDLLLHTAVDAFPGAELFGYASTKKTLAETLELHWTVTADGKAATAVYGMLLSLHTRTFGPYREDSLYALDSLSFAKALMDVTSCHSRPTIDATAEVLLAAQAFADEATIPCTEWPLAAEIAAVALEAGKRYARVGTWRVLRYNEMGAITGVDEVEY